MSDSALNASARQERVQPSLWDRLVDDLPGMLAETDSLRSELSKELGASINLDAMVSGGVRVVEQQTTLSTAQRKKLSVYVTKMAQRNVLQERGIVVDSSVLREAVRRDIEMLFNIERMEAEFLLTDHEMLTSQSTASQLADFPQVRSSVINYGVPSFSGRRGSDFDKDDLEREIRNVLHVFEPRLKKNTVRVKVKISDKTGMLIDIDGVLLLSPVPERLRLSTAIDLDNGQATTTLEEV